MNVAENLFALRAIEPVFADENAGNRRHFTTACLIAQGEFHRRTRLLGLNPTLLYRQLRKSELILRYIRRHKNQNEMRGLTSMRAIRTRYTAAIIQCRFEQSKN